MADQRQELTPLQFLGVIGSVFVGMTILFYWVGLYDRSAFVASLAGSLTGLAILFVLVVFFDVKPARFRRTDEPPRQ